MNEIYTAKSSWAGQVGFCKKKLRWTKYILKRVASVGKIYTMKSNLGKQNMYCKK